MISGNSIAEPFEMGVGGLKITRRSLTPSKIEMSLLKLDIPKHYCCK